MNSADHDALEFPHGVEYGKITSFDGLQLRSVEVGRSEGTIAVLLMPAGLQPRIVAPLAVALAKNYRFVTWETRLSPGSDGDDNTACDVEAHLGDLRAIVDVYAGATPVHLIAWCSSAQLAIRYARRRPGHVASMTLIGPYLRGIVADPERRLRNR
jgi:pimeloyl-ACP methyl ester carboxylesterase